MATVAGIITAGHGPGCRSLVRPTTLAGCDGESPADFDADQGGPPGGREGPAQAGVARWSWSLAARRGSARPGGPGRSGPRRPAAMAGAGAGRSDADVAVRVPARLGCDDGRGLRAPAQDGDRAGDLWRRPPWELRLLRLARTRLGLRPQRLRRGPSRTLGMGPAPADHQRVGGRPPERPVRRHLRGRGPVVRECLPAAAAPAGREAAAGPLDEDHG